MRQDRQFNVRVASADPVEATLFAILQLVNDWLRFAEAKNVGIVGLASGALAILLGYLTSQSSLPTGAGVALALGGIGLVASLLVGLISFFPRTNVPRQSAASERPPGPTDSLYYFGHLATFAPADLAAAVSARYPRDPPLAVGDVHRDLATQVIINARITLWKLRLFMVAVIAFALGVLISAVGVVLAALA